MLSSQEQSIVLYGKQQGKSPDEISTAITKFRQQQQQMTLNANNTPQAPQQNEVPADFNDRTTAQQIFSKEFLNQVPEEVYKTIVGNALKFVKSAAEVPANIIQSAQGKPIETLKINDPVTGQPLNSFQTDFQNKILPAVESGEMTPAGGTLRTVGGTVLGAVDVFGAESLVKGAVNTAVKGAQAVKNTIENLTKNISSRPGLQNVENISERIKNFFSNDIDEKAATILRETPTAKLDEYVQIAQEAATDPRKLTPFEVVGDKVTEATKQLQQQTKSFSQQKKQIITKAKNGLTTFSKEAGETILEVRNAVKNSKVGKQVITILKKVKTKLDADNAIDEIQDMLYKGNKDMTIPQGSSEDKALRGILGKFNGKLKATLPKAYADLNAKISEHIKIVDSLNRALGETVEGVATRGASLIKQFFSGSGRKSKELFDYIKANTGIDLSQDATLARFTMEMFDDARARMLLEGLPKSPSGLVEKAIDVVVDKSGIGKGIQTALRKNTLNKARGLTK